MDPKDLRSRQQEIIALQDELLTRRRNDPLLSWGPFDKQRVFIDAVLKGETRQAWYLGANRSGKSEAGAYIGSHLARFGPPDPKPLPHAGASIQVRDKATSGWVVSLDTNISRDVIETKYFDNNFLPPGANAPFIPEREIKEWRVADKILKLKNGSLIGFKSCDSDVKKFQGTGKDWVHYDEEPPKPIYDESVIRVEAGRVLRIFGTCTILPPDGEIGGVSWIYDSFIKPYNQGVLKDCKLFGASIYDNPHIGRSEIALLESIYPANSIARRIRLEGEWLPGIGGALAYPAFNRGLHVKPQDAVISRRPLCWIWDFNVEPFITHVGQMEGEVFRVIQQLYLESGSIPEMCDYFKELYPGHHGEVYIYGDETGTHRSNQSGKSDYTLIMNEMRRYGSPIRLKLPRVNPSVPDRVNAMNRALRNEEGELLVQIDPSCIELIDDFEQVLRDPRGGLKKSHNRKDPYYKRTHASDGIGYWVAYEAPVKRLNIGERIVRAIPQVGYAFR